MHDFDANPRFGAPYAQVSPTGRTVIDQQIMSELKANRYADGALQLSTFHGKKEPTLLEKNVVLAVGNCGLYTGPWSVRVEDAVLVGSQGPKVLTGYPRSLVIQ